MGFNFLQEKLLALWKLAGRLDYVDLGRGFFLTRLSLREDYENVLRKGPWFFSDHFLSIRPWESDFKPALANVSSIAVWIRLNELPIKYYNPKALNHIGKAIGNILRVDTFTATESRGRFARLCIQVDVEKPLITVVMIGKLEQQISYEGIQKLCFRCGRIGHKKENYPYFVQQEPPSVEVGRNEQGDRSSNPHEMRVPDSLKGMKGTNEAVHEPEQGTVHEGAYGPWVVMARRKQGTKN